MPTQQEMRRFNRILEEVEERLHSERGLHVEYVPLLTAVMDAYGAANPETLCTMELDADAILAKLAGREFDVPRILGSIDAPELLVPGGLGAVRAALGSRAGFAWEILSHPSDPFPSDPCAHNEAEDVTLDLATGVMYHDRVRVHSLFRKDLAAFRAKVAAKYPGLVLPPLRGTEAG